jgi:hypothetical protein
MEMKELTSEERVQKKEKGNPYNDKGGSMFSRLLILAILVGLVQIGINVYGNYAGKDLVHKNLMLSLDSIQVQQNNTIIKLLEKQPIRDTVVVHIVAPVE